jgi:cytochrome P450
MWSEADYENPSEFDGYRFIKRRKIPGFEHRSHLISTSPEHMAFSHGKHACPGRFFAANEVKIAMVHVLLKYDIRLEDPSGAAWKEWGTSMFTNPKARMAVRRRKEEINVDGLQ